MELRQAIPNNLDISLLSTYYSIASWVQGILSIMQTRYYYWFSFTYRFPWVGSGQGRIARVSR